MMLGAWSIVCRPRVLVQTRCGRNEPTNAPTVTRTTGITWRVVIASCTQISAYVRAECRDGRCQPMRSRSALTAPWRAYRKERLGAFLLGSPPRQTCSRIRRAGRFGIRPVAWDAGLGVERRPVPPHPQSRFRPVIRRGATHFLRRKRRELFGWDLSRG